MGGGDRRRRRLGPDERQLWERVVETASPLHGRRGAKPRAAASPAALAVPEDVPAAEQAGALAPSLPEVRFVPARRDRPATVRFAPPEAGPVGRPEAGLDRRTAERLRKGARAPDARIDLHGMTAERAHGACLGFLGQALARGDRVVLVITGKGRRREDGWRDGRGVLRESLPGWLRASPLGHSIVGIYQANRRHGGEGAFYVYLKRRR